MVRRFLTYLLITTTLDPVLFFFCSFPLTFYNGETLIELYHLALLHKLYQANVYFKTKVNLSNMERLHASLGSPAFRLKCIHVAGTNGKVSSLVSIVFHHKNITMYI
jgi:hypothetical protein